MPNQTTNHASLNEHMGLFQMFAIHCDYCGENRWERVLVTPVEDEIETQNLRPLYTEEAWKDGWRLRNNSPICPECQEDEEEGTCFGPSDYPDYIDINHT